jgi:hypothetical protein
MAFAGPLIASAVAYAANQDFLNKGWTYLATYKQNEYYGDSISLMTLLLLRGNWWAPDAVLPTSLGKGKVRKAMMRKSSSLGFIGDVGSDVRQVNGKRRP